MSTSRSRLRPPSLAVVALAATLALLVPGALVAHADDLETPSDAAAVAVASGEPGGDLVEAAEPAEVTDPVEAGAPVEAAEPAKPAEPAGIAEPVDIADPADEVVDEGPAEPATELIDEAIDEPAGEPVVPPVAENDPASADEQAPAAALSLVAENLPVVTQDDYYVIAPGATLAIGAPGILGNDSDPEDDPFVAQQGSFTTWLGNTGYIGPNGEFGFTAAAGFTGTDTITYFTQDAGHGGTEGTIYVTVQEQVDPTENHWVSPADDYYTTPKNETLVIPSHLGVLANDIDDDGDVITTQAKIGMPTNEGGSVWIDADGSFGYTPPMGFTGTDWFSYIAYDTFGGASWASVQIGVTGTGTVPGGPNLPPVAGEDHYVIADGHTLVVDAAHGLLLNDSDPDGGYVTLLPETTTTQIGVSVDVAADGSFAYTPKPGTWGDDYFSYTITDEAGLTTLGFASFEVAPFVPVEEPPTTDPGTVVPIVGGGTGPSLPSPPSPEDPAPTTIATGSATSTRDENDDTGLASTGFGTTAPLAGGLGLLLLGAVGLVLAVRRRAGRS
ncbi:Ig-like domain-containing protein [Agreia sp. PsM10]|uniref:Ig-like domain-containing protein n=1 Tax=Agreia sp. PsM10 TaxID=3030533 RepID=UPI00263BE56C|nr:Ig-like domain-containing protein [Agreia sp. PsM10]MDN4639841.1 Ig-like domain-containing protein [Agreia sp. PsM10]